MTRPSGKTVKVRASIQEGSGSGFSKYRELYHGRTGLMRLVIAELLTSLLGGLPGPAGLFLRSRTYPRLFRSAGRPVFIGRNVTFRHLSKITLGSNVIIDDNCMIDAKGADNRGITLGDDVYIGRNTIVYCKNGDIDIEAGVNISSNCTVFSSNHLTLGRGTVIGAYSYLLSGGEYDHRDPTPFAEQSGMQTRGPLSVGANCWLGTRVTVLDAANIGEHCVIGAGAVVNKPIPAHHLAAGVPAKVLKAIDPSEMKDPV